MRKIIAVLLTALILAGATSVGATSSYSGNVASLLAELKIMQGDPDGNLRLDDLVSRAECTKIVVASSSWRDTVAIGSKTSPFKDVPADNWAAPYVSVAVKNGLCKGYLDATFRPNSTVLFEEALTMFLRVLGYSDEDFGNSWPDGQIGIAQNIGLCDGLNKAQGQALSRLDMMIIAYNVLCTPAKGESQDYLSRFNRSITDDVVLIASNFEDSAVGAGKVTTSAGTFKVTENFDYSNIGRRGSISVRNNDTIVAFIPNSQLVEEYVVSDTKGADIFYGSSILDVDSGTEVYYKSKSYTYENMISLVDAGDVCKVFRNEGGSVDYIMFVSRSKSATLTDKITSRYVVYSILDDSVITYNNGNFGQVTFTDETAFYEDEHMSTFSQISSKLTMGDLLNVKYKPNGAIDYVIYEEGNTIGPITINHSAWYTDFGVSSADSATIMRNGMKVEASDIKVNDIAYYSSDLNMFMIYNDKVTGIYESASPNKDVPASITVSGVTYAIEGVEAFTKLSSSGSFTYGDTVTLLLGKNGEVADVASQASLSQDTIYGYLIESGTKETTVGTSKVTKPYVSVVLPSGEFAEYISLKIYDDILNSIVKVSFDDGVAKVTAIEAQSSLSGRFLWSGNSGSIGSQSLSSDIEILEVSTVMRSASANVATVFPGRLNKVNLSHTDILYAEKDNSGKISKLILHDVTGDMHSYGIITDVNNRSMGMSISGVYTYLCDGSKRTVSTNGVLYTVSKSQPVQIVTSYSGTIEGIRSIVKTASGKGTKISGSDITVGDEQYTLSDKIQIYSKSATYDYSMLTKDELAKNIKNYTLTLYSDKNESDGGKVRIIVAVPK